MGDLDVLLRHAKEGYMRSREDLRDFYWPICGHGRHALTPGVSQA